MAVPVLLNKIARSFACAVMPSNAIDDLSASERHARPGSGSGVNCGGHPRNSERVCGAVSWIPASAGMTPLGPAEVETQARVHPVERNR
jgi:hypothetical protein